MRFNRLPLALSMLFAGCLVAHAGNGRLEINQTCAENSGCFAGDTPGFPVQITSHGSYVLTGSLQVPAATDGVEVTAENVTIDLNGFSIEGPVTCTGTPVTGCSASSGAQGVDASSQRGTTVTAGSISGFGASGVHLGDHATASQLRVSENASSGLSVGGHSRVEDIRSERNANYGVDTGVQSTVENAVAFGNGYRGIATDDGSTIVDSSSSQNADIGIFAGSHNTVRGVSSTSNQDDGIMLYNGNSVLVDSTAGDNTGFGVNCLYGGDSALSNVVLNYNNSNNAQFDGQCLETGANVCQGSTTCP
jgi:hypothetical protein